MASEHGRSKADGGAPHARAPLTILVEGIGGAGKAHPMIALSQALHQRGHRVYFLSDGRSRRLAERLGVEFVEFPPPDGQGPQRCGPSWVSSSWVGRGLVQWSVRRQLLRRHLPWSYDQIKRRQAPGKTVVLGGWNMYAARIAQETLGVPFASVYLHPAQMRSSYEAPGLPVPYGAGWPLRAVRRCLWASIGRYVDFILKPEVNRFRSELGLASLDAPLLRWIYSPDLILGLFPDWFASPQPDWPPNTHLLGFPLFDQSGVSDLPGELEQFLAAGEPPIVFTRGSHSSRGRKFFETSVEVCKLTGRRGLLLAPSVEAVPLPLPDTILHLPYVPLSAVLGRAAAIVHHGGIGTTALSLAAGVPQLIVPAVEDQHDTAWRVQRLGAGLQIPAGAYRAKHVTERLGALLESEEVTRTCESLAARAQQQNPLPEACRLIESLVTG